MSFICQIASEIHRLMDAKVIIQREMPEFNLWIKNPWSFIEVLLLIWNCFHLVYFFRILATGDSNGWHLLIMYKLFFHIWIKKCVILLGSLILSSFCPKIVPSSLTNLGHHNIHNEENYVKDLSLFFLTVVIYSTNCYGNTNINCDLFKLSHVVYI